MKLPKFLSVTIVFLFCVIVLLPIFSIFLAPLIEFDFGFLTKESFIFEKRHLGLATNSLSIASGATAISIFFGVPLAFIIQKTNLWMGKAIGYLSIIPFLIPSYIHGIVWTHVNTFLRQYWAFDVHGLGGAIFILALAYFPFVTLLTLCGLKSIDKNLEEASLLCHGTWHTLRHVTCPLAVPHMVSGAIFVFIFSLIDFGVPDILRLRVYPVEIFIQYSAFYNENSAALMSLPLIVLTFFLLGFQNWYMKDKSYVQLSGGSLTMKYSLGGWQFFGLCYSLFIIGLSVILPLGVLVKVAGPFSTYLNIFNSSINQIGSTLILASCTAFFTLVFGFCLSFIINNSKGMMMFLLSHTIFFPLAVPGTTMGIGFIKVWNQPMLDHIYGSLIIIILGCIARFIPFSFIIINSGFKQINPRLIEAAIISTSSFRKIVTEIFVPLNKYSLLGAFVVVFILSLGELGTTLMIIPPGGETLPIKIYNLMHYGAEQMVAALSLILILFIFGFSGIGMLFYQKGKKECF